MTHPVFQREKARALRRDRHLSIDQIATRLALPRSTVFYCVRDLRLGRARRASEGQRKGTRAMSRRYRLLREQAYEEGRASFDLLAVEPTFRDFVCNKVSYLLQYHADQRLDELVAFWAARLDIGVDEVKLLRKSNSNRLSGRTWRSQYGVLTVRVGDTMLRARLQAWMDRVREDWIDSPDGA
jgi:hypothetical protein